MWRFILILTFLVQSPFAVAGGLFGNNKADDSFVVKAIEGRTATLQGSPKDLKPGDTLYFNKSPFKFTVTEVKGSSVSVALPERHELAPGAALIRNPTDAIKKALETESKLKQALEE